MPSLPAGVTAYHATPVFTQSTVPRKLLHDHATKAGVWGRIVVLSGKLRYEMVDRGDSFQLGPGDDGVIVPEAPHRVQPLGEVRFFVEFLR